MQQSQPHAPRPDPRIADIAQRLVAAAPALAAEVARDVSGVPDAEEEAAALAAVTWLLDVLRAGTVPSGAALRVLRDRAAAEARAGRPLRPVLDRTLSAGWVVWAAAGRQGDTGPDALAALGEALLRTGDAAAAALADAHATAEREAVARSVSARRELLDEILELREGDADGRARLLRRAADLGIPPDRPVGVVVALLPRDLEEDDPAVVAVARALARGGVPSLGDPRGLGGPLPVPVVATTRGHLVVLTAAPARPDLDAALVSLGPERVCVAAAAGGLTGVGAALREATAAALVAARVGRRGALLPVKALLLERALLAEPALLRAAVDEELGPVVRAPRSAALVETLEAFLSERENVRATARHLGVAPRTVAYRLERIERLLGGPLDAARRLRLAAALFARRLLADGAAAASPVSPPGEAADRSPRLPGGRSSSRRSPARGS